MRRIGTTQPGARARAHAVRVAQGHLAIPGWRTVADFIRSSSKVSIFMKTWSSPSVYEKSMLALSTCASGKVSPAFQVFSSVFPFSRFFSLERTNAGPLPGLTCKNSVTFHTLPSNSMVKPVLKSVVDPIIIGGVARRAAELSAPPPRWKAAHGFESKKERKLHRRWVRKTANG